MKYDFQKHKTTKVESFGDHWTKIFSGGKKKKSKSKKVKKTICPHCATKNFVEESRWERKCLKCGWDR